MANIDSSIALGYKPIQIEDPINRFARQQEASVNALKMQEMQQSVQDRNMLRSLDPSAKDYIQQVGRVNPKLALELQKGRADTAKSQVELEAKLMTNARNTLAPVKDQATYDIWRQNTISQLPGLTALIPAKFDNNVKTSLMLEADKYISQTQISAAQQATIDTTRRGQDLQYNPELQGKIAASKKRAEGEVAREVQGQVDVVANRKALATAGYNPETGKDDISDLIKKSTGSYIGKAVDIGGRTFGTSTEGSKALQTLTQKANAITFGLLNGKLGAGISKSDAELVASLVGQLGDGTLPTEDRLAAWESAKSNMVRLGLIDTPKANLGPNIKTPGSDAAPAAKPSLDSIFGTPKK